MFSSKTFLLCLLILSSLCSEIDLAGNSGEKKLYDYWTTFVNDGRLRESDILTVFGQLLGLKQRKEAELPRHDHDSFGRAMARIGQRFMEMISVINTTNVDCRREVREILSSLASLAYDLTSQCENSTQNNTNAAICHQRKQNLVKERIWAAKLLNAWGAPSAGLLTQGQFLWYGNYHQCVRTKVPRRGSDHKAARYCLITIGPSFEEWAIPHEEPGSVRSLRAQLGACLPPSCVEYDSSDSLKMILGVLTNTSVELSSKMRETLGQHHVFCEPAQLPSWDSSQWVVVILICALVVLVLAGTVTEYWLRVRAEKRRSEKRLQRILEAKNNQGSIIESAHTTDWLDSVKQWLDFESVISFKSQESLRHSIRRLKWWLHLVKAFSVRMNVGWLASSQTSNANGERPGNRITCLYGIRVLTMMWVIVGHTYVFAMPHLSNLVEATERMPLQFFSQVILNSSLSVDTFFLISGLLNCYMWCLRQLTIDQQKPNRYPSWLAYYGHRYFRLVPPYALVIAIVTSGLYSGFGRGPRWEASRISGVQCDRNTWWRHLFFLNNLISGGEHCLPWMWHLAIDMQCFIVAPVFIIPLWKRPKFGIGLIIGAVAASAVARGLVVGLMRLPTNLMLFLPSDNFRNDFHVYFDLIYQKPYFRCGPYLIGLLTGWTLATKTEKPRMWRQVNWKKKVIVRASIFTLCFWPLFGLFPLMSGDFYSPVYNGIFAAVNRTMWSMGVAMIIISCHCQFGCSYLNAVFSWIGWWPFARLNYGVYLIHELLIVYVVFNLRSPITYDGHVSLLAYFALFTAISYALALILFVTAEGPVLAAERLLFRRKPGSERKRNRKIKGVLDNPDQHRVKIDRQRMTERWASTAGKSQSSQSTPTGIQLYKAEDTVRVAVVDEAVEVGSKTAESVESSVQSSISEHFSVGGSKSVTIHDPSYHTEQETQEDLRQ